MDFPTFNDLFAIARDEITSRNPRISVDAVQRDGSDANVLTAAAAAVGDECVGELTEVNAALYLDSASDTDLDRLVFDRFGITRKPASAAVGSIQFATLAPNPTAFSIPAGTQVGSSTGQNYVTIQPVTFPLGSLGPIVAPIRSTLAGSDQQAGIGTITSLLGQISNSPDDLFVTNVLATAGASDDEKDESLRARARQFYVNARRGTLSAIIAGALAVDGVQSANAFEILDSAGHPGRLVILVVTDAFTDQLAALDEDPPQYQAQSQVLSQTVFAELDDVRPAGIFVDVQVAQVVLQPITLALTFSAGADVNGVTQTAIAVIVNYVNSLAPGATLSYAGMIDALRTVSGLIISGRDVYSPSGDVVPTVLQAIRASFSIVVPLSAVPGLTISASVEPDA